MLEKMEQEISEVAIEMLSIFDNMSIGMCMGISLGVAVGSIIDARNRVNNKEDKQITSESDDNEENE
jgi:hypothetical protein